MNYIVEVWDGGEGEWRERERRTRRQEAIEAARKWHEIEGTAVRVLKVEWQA